eukprot:3541690-Amphidinium_carterae.1
MGSVIVLDTVASCKQPLATGDQSHGVAQVLVAIWEGCLHASHPQVFLASIVHLAVCTHLMHMPTEMIQSLIAHLFSVEMPHCARTKDASDCRNN